MILGATHHGLTRRPGKWPTWPPEREARLRELAADGVPPREIARRLGGGLTTKSIREKAARMGLSLALKPQPMKWPPERVARLRDLAAEGLSAAQIAERLGGGTTRNAVIGKVERLGIVLGGDRSAAEKLALATKVKQRPPRVAGGRKGAAPKPAAVAPSPAPTPTPAPPAPARSPEPAPPAPVDTTRPCVGILELRDSMCCWPIGDPGRPGFGYCGAPRLAGTTGTSPIPYCAPHCRIAYQPATERRRVR